MTNRDILLVGAAIAVGMYAYHWFVPPERGEPVQVVSAVECVENAPCWIERTAPPGTTACEREIAARARFEHRWTEWSMDRFPARTAGEGRGHVRFAGRAVEFKDGAGRWHPHAYACVYDGLNRRVIALDVNPA